MQSSLVGVLSCVSVMQFFCPACGIATTSEANLQDHLSGRKHGRRVQHLAKSSFMQPAATPLSAFGELLPPQIRSYMYTFVHLVFTWFLSVFRIKTNVFVSNFV